ncbi:TOM1-like protein 5 [Lathyrus oleraceus]|uniref:TOM1-like protein 5 n=1 Tax=Pisum sativum TaxID=3888 RepID=UPI0021D0ADC4|nr:TOM1-like protein 5 [Pisum sativum]
MTSRDERIVSRAIEVNEQFQKSLDKHYELLSSQVTTTVNHFDCEEAEEEEEEPEQLFRRLRKGKACVRPGDEETEPQFPRLSLLEERLNRPLIRPLESSQEAHTAPVPVVVPPPSAKPPPVTIPPPPQQIQPSSFTHPAKHNQKIQNHVQE